MRRSSLGPDSLNTFSSLIMIYQDAVCFVIYIALDSLRFLSLWIFFFLTSFRNCTIISLNIASAMFSFLLVGLQSHVVRSSGLVRMSYSLCYPPSFFFFKVLCAFSFLGWGFVCFFGGMFLGVGASFWLRSVDPSFSVPQLCLLQNTICF